MRVVVDVAVTEIDVDIDDDVTGRARTHKCDRRRHPFIP
jgi:hypothetical protein